ncbi:hypothetical protein VPHK460_0321 [Vibrio phage K460]
MKAKSKDMPIPSRMIKFMGVEIIADECKQVGVK